MNRLSFMKTEWGFLFSLLFLLFSPMLGFCEPAIERLEGVPYAGNIMIVRGTGFGNDGPSVIVFDDFESGSTGNPVNTGAGSATFGEWDNTRVWVRGTEGDRVRLGRLESSPPILRSRHGWSCAAVHALFNLVARESPPQSTVGSQRYWWASPAPYRTEKTRRHLSS